MSREQIEKIVFAAVHETCAWCEVGLKSRFIEDLGMDWIDYVWVVMEIEQSLGRAIFDDEVCYEGCVEDLVLKICNR